MANNVVIRSMVVMLIGLLLLFLSDSAMPLLIRIVGAAFFLPALVSVIHVYVSRAESKIVSKLLITIIDVGSMAFGVWLMVAPANFENVFVKLLAVALLVFAVFQIVTIASAQRFMIISMLMYITPLLLVVAAIILFAVTIESLETVSMIFGTSAVISGLSDLFIYLKLKAAKHKGISTKDNPVQKY